ADADAEGAPPGGRAVRRAGVRARDAGPRDAPHRPGDHPRGTLDDLPLPGTTSARRPVGGDLHRIRAKHSVTMSTTSTSARAPLIRDLDADEFARRYGADRFT